MVGHALNAEFTSRRTTVDKHAPLPDQPLKQALFRREPPDIGYSGFPCRLAKEPDRFLDALIGDDVPAPFSRNPDVTDEQAGDDEKDQPPANVPVKQCHQPYQPDETRNDEDEPPIHP